MKIYIDMDGVIADFQGWIKQHIPDINEDMWRNSDIPWKFMSDNYTECYLTLNHLHFLQYADYLYNNLNDVKFLTALPKEWWDNTKGEIAMLNKTTWLENHINNFNADDVIFTPGASAKLKYAGFGTVLYDDREDTIHAWNKTGGIGVLVKGQ